MISNLGDKPQEVTCPWCAGEGVRVQGIDAQAGWLEKGAAHGGTRHGASSST